MCVCVSAHLHNFKTKISFSCYAMPAHLITKRVGGVRVSLKGRQLSVEAVLPRGVELTALLGQRSTEEQNNNFRTSLENHIRFWRRMEVSACRGSDEGRRLANLFQQVAVDCKVILLSMEWFSYQCLDR